MIKFSTLFFLILKYDLCIQCTVYSLDRKKIGKKSKFWGFFLIKNSIYSIVPLSRQLSTAIDI